MKNFKLIGISAFTLLMLIFTSSVKAQESRFGIKGGVNVSNMYTNDIHDENTKIGLNGGFFLKAALSEHIALQPELLFTMKGSELEFDTPFADGTGSFSLNYIEVPMMGVFNITKNFNIHAGVYIASLINVTIENEGSVSLFDFEAELDRDNFETFDYGLVGGVGLDFNKLSLGIRYDYGLNTVGKKFDFPNGSSDVFPDARNSNLALYLSISFF